jgi:hypothetical protein
MFLKIFRESFYRRLNWPGRSVTQRTERLALDVIAEIEHQLNVFGATTAI